ncbi:MAG: anthranilate phosphoribosyltransferase [Oligoflexales bacterium]
MITQILDQLLSGQDLEHDQVISVFTKMFQGQLSEAQIGAFLAAWRLKGERGTDLQAGAECMRSVARVLNINPNLRPLIDNCGTGGDGAGTFNISTTAAVVAAACGARVAKHGNRSVSSKCGSADLFFGLGFPDTLKSDAILKLLERTGLTFFFAPQFHPLMKHVMPVRKSLGVRTIFNLLGPLANPLKPEYQLLGVGRKEYLRPMAEACSRLGLKRGLIVHSQDGLDEISPCAKTDAYWVKEDQIESYCIDPKDYNIEIKEFGLKGGGVEENVEIFWKILNHDREDDLFSAVKINAGAVLWVCGIVPNLEEGLEKAGTALANGSVLEYFTNWLKLANDLSTKS